MQHGAYVQARQDLEEASRIDPKNPFIWASLAETYLRLNEEKQAAEAAETAKKSSSHDPVLAHALAIFYFDYADVLLKREEFTQAAAVVQSGLAAQPGDARLTLALGVARYGQRRFDEAIAEFLKVIQIDPAIVQPYIFLGKMLDQAGGRLGEITQAARTWAQANPDNAEAQLLLAKVMLASNSRDAAAETLLRRSIGLDPNQWESHYQLGVFLAAERDYEGAAAELNRAIELDPRQPETHYHLARVYDRLGKPDRAQAERDIHQQLTGSRAPNHP